MWHSIHRRHIDGTKVPFEVVEMVGLYLDQLAGNNECGFYAMWAMLRYIRGKSPEADKLVCIIPIPFIYVNNSTKRSTYFSFIRAFGYHLFFNDSARNLNIKGC
jgi:hypothetical protein